MRKKKPKRDFYLYPIQRNDGIGYRVKIPKYNIDKAFTVKDYGTTTLAHDAAIHYRDQAIAQGKVQKTNQSIIEKAYTVQFAFERSIVFKSKTKETVRKWRLWFNKYFKPYANKPLAELKAADISEHLNSYVDQISNGMMSTLLSLWRQIYNAAILDDVIHVNYADVVPKPISKKMITPRPVMTNTAALQQIIISISRHRGNNRKAWYDNQLIIYALLLMYYLGIRPAECFAIKRNAIDFKKQTISIGPRIGSTASDELTIVLPKTPQSVRELPLIPEVVLILRNLMKYSKYDLLFQRFDGSFMCSRWFSRKIRWCCKKEGIDFHAYQLRHYFAKRLMDNRVTPRTLMDLMGHASFGMSIGYDRSSMDDRRSAIEQKTDF